jgi:hypothetical protein
VRVVIIHSDFATSGSRDDFIFTPNTGTHGWEQMTETFTASRDYAQLRILLVYRNASGSAWFDDFSFGQNGGELMGNPSLEEHTPNGWEGLDTTTEDQPDCSVDHSGDCSYLMVGETDGGGTALNKRLLWVENIAGSAGDSFDLSFWNRTQNAAGAYQVRVVIIHSDFATSGSRDDFIFTPNTGTHGWEQMTETFTASRDYAQLRILLVYRNASGSVWFDDFSFTCE